MLEDNPEQQLFGLTYMLDRGFKKVRNRLPRCFVRVSFYVSFSSLHYKLIFIQLDLLKSGSPDVARDEKERHTFLQLVNKIFSGLSVL